MNGNNHTLKIGFLFLVLVILISNYTSNVVGSVYEGPYIDSPWRVGAPWEEIKVVYNILEDERMIKNVTIYYGINTIQNFNRDNMTLISGTINSGKWEYVFPGYGNNTELRFYTVIYFTNGDKHPHKIVDDDVRLFKILIPKDEFLINYLYINDINEKKLTCGIMVQIEVLNSVDLEYTTINLRNRIRPNFIRNDEYLEISSSSQRFRYFKNLNIDELNLILVKDTVFPRDKYYLDLEFQYYGSKFAHIDIDRIYINPDNNAHWDIELLNLSTNMKDKIYIKIGVERKIESIKWFYIPFIVFIYILGGTPLLIKDKKGERIRIYAGILIFLLQYSFTISSFIPEKIIGSSFPEIFFQWMFFFVGIFIITYLFCAFLKEIINLSSKVYLDLFFDFIAIFFIYMIIFKIRNTTGETLYTMMPSDFNIVFILGISYGFIIHFIYIVVDNKKLINMFLESIRNKINKFSFYNKIKKTPKNK